MCGCVCEHLFGAAALWTDCCTCAPQGWSLQGSSSSSLQSQMGHPCLSSSSRHTGRWSATLGEEATHWEEKLHTGSRSWWNDGNTGFHRILHPLICCVGWLSQLGQAGFCEVKGQMTWWGSYGSGFRPFFRTFSPPWRPTHLCICHRYSERRSTSSILFLALVNDESPESVWFERRQRWRQRGSCSQRCRSPEPWNPVSCLGLDVEDNRLTV